MNKTKLLILHELHFGRQVMLRDYDELMHAKRIVQLGTKLKPLIKDEDNKEVVSKLSNEIFELRTPAMLQFEYLMNEIQRTISGNSFLSANKLIEEVNKLANSSAGWYRLFNEYCSVINKMSKDDFYDYCLKHKSSKSLEYVLLKAYDVYQMNIFPLTYIAMMD